MWPDPILEFRGISLDPAEDRGVGDLDAAVLQHEFQIAVDDREHEIPADRPEDHLARELPTLLAGMIELLGAASPVLPKVACRCPCAPGNRKTGIR